jgi:hypothetical protein
MRVRSVLETDVPIGTAFANDSGIALATRDGLNHPNFIEGEYEVNDLLVNLDV